MAKATADWDPLQYGGIAPKAGEFGKTTVMPELFNGMQAAYQPLYSWYQWLNNTGHRTIMAGAGAGNTIAEDYKVGLAGLVFLDKAIRITEIKMQIGDKKLPRINIEEAFVYNKPALIFEEGFIIDEEQAFELWGYVEGPIPNEAPFIVGLYQNIVMIGAAYYKLIDKVLGNCGAAIT